MYKWISCIAILFLVIALTSEYAIAQNTIQTTDSVASEKGKKTNSVREKNRKGVYQHVVKPIADKLPNKDYKNLIQKKYGAFEGKVIRNIIIEPLGPFGYSITDTTAIPHNKLSNIGNKLHITSKRRTVRNLLLFSTDQLFDSLLVTESERMLRSQSYVRDVVFIVKPTSYNSDSVDIFIRELDNWSIIPSVAASSLRIAASVKEMNLAGLGHETNNGLIMDKSSGKYSYSTNYYIPNISNTFISALLHYNTDQYRNYSNGVSLDRVFFSPLARWAGGVAISQQYRSDSIQASGSYSILRRYKFNSQDYWGGRAFKILKGNSENARSSNFIVAARLLRVRYSEKPGEMADPDHVYSNEDFYLASFGISTRNYVQDRYIFKYGVPEDIPLGRSYSFTGGYQVKNNSGRLYIGVRISTGNYYSWGYLGSNYEYGTFFGTTKTEQGLFSIGAVYFTGLKEIGKWKFRQFVKPQLSIGINRFVNDSLTLNDGYGIDGFNSNGLSGTSRLLVTFQTQSYTPWSLLGFHFGPFINYTLGLLGTESTGFKQSKIYSQLGLGVLVKNEHLVINTFQISIAFYPLIPGTGNNIVKMNSLKSTDFGLRDFDIGKPVVAPYQ